MQIDSYFKILLLFGAVFTFLLSIYFLFYPNNFFANKVLGLLTVSWSVTVFGFMIQSKDFFAQYPHFYASLDAFVFLFFPLMFIYIKTYLFEDARKVLRWWPHFIPVVLYVLVFSPFLFQGSATKAKQIAEGMPDWFYLLQNIFSLFVVLQGVIYSVLSLRTLHHFRYFRTDRLTENELASVRWLELFTSVNVLLWIVGTSGAFLDIFRIAIPIDLFAVFYFGLTILTIVLGVFTLRHPQFFAMKEDIRLLVEASQEPARRIKEKKMEEEDSVESPEYKTLLRYIEVEKPYLKNDLKMRDLADGTGISERRISDVLNNVFKKSFFDVINEYRTQMAIKLIKDGFHKQHTLPHLAEEAGFNSKTTFNRIFKKHVGMTPTDYIRTLE